MSGPVAVEADPQARRRQTLTFSFWAIDLTLKEQHAQAIAELIHAQRSGASTSPAAAKLTALEDLRYAFEAQVNKEPSPHAS